MRETDIRLLMEISPDRELRPGWQRGVEIQRTRTIKAGDLLYCSSYPIWDTATRRDAQQARCIENLTDKLNAMNDEAAKLQAERDAAVALIPRACAYCKWYGTKHGGFFPDCKNPNGCRNVSGINTGWQWRGAPKEE